MDNPTAQWEDKCWGRVMHIFANNKAGISYLEVKKGWQCSRHFHKQRRNTFAVVSGKLLIVEWGVDENGMPGKTVLFPGQSYTVPTFIDHRFCVLESGVVVEYYDPEREWHVVDVNDIVRKDIGGKIKDG